MRATSTSPRELVRFWWAALVCFAIAALTGVLFRGTTSWGWAHGISLVNVRHAHSHLMFFGWVTPAIMLLVAARTAAMRGARMSRAMGHVIGATLTLGVASHPLFLRFGYAPAVIGDARVPLSVIVAGLNMIAWYAFVARYVRETRGMTRNAALASWDLALVTLVVSSAGAWSLALLRPLGLDVERGTAIGMHLFLDPFSEGWLVLAALGLAYDALGIERARPRVTLAIALASTLAFGLAVPRGVVPDALRWVSAGAGLVWGGALLSEIVRLARAPRAKELAVPLAMGAIAAVARVVASATPWIAWTSMAGLRLLYLHALLLGLVTLTIVLVARRVIGPRAVPARGVLQAAVIVLLATLVPLSEVWPAAWGGAWTIGVATAGAVGMAIVATSALVASVARPRAI
ncbi:hypothetical protein [Sandaracinus amylolyticus]|uniref:hypothetical protein n=1 Tax=Sandaracinus amylolyticus TaxID=927083 RepID=UPI001F2658FF|nr:hypothetical protein [Sandaracinus amylolyticus]UJR84119.1 Hypothetical protein I5071_61900 [Sandaracinus amylolyticus]